MRALERFLLMMLQEHRLRARRRAQAVWHSHQGRSVDWIAQHYKVHKSTVWEWFKTYKEKGVNGLKGLNR